MIAFNFKKKIPNDDQSDRNFMDCVKYLPAYYKMIYSFCSKFYINLIKEMTIQESLNDARANLKVDIL